MLSQMNAAFDLPRPTLTPKPALHAARQLAVRLSDIDIRFWTRSKKLARVSVTMGVINGTGRVRSCPLSL